MVSSLCDTDVITSYTTDEFYSHGDSFIRNCTTHHFIGPHYSYFTALKMKNQALQVCTFVGMTSWFTGIEPRVLLSDVVVLSCEKRRLL